MLFWTLFIGIGAVAGSIGMFVAPDGSALGMDKMLPYFQVLPFAKLLYRNFIFPGVALLIINGITNLVAALLLRRKKSSGAYFSCAFGVTLMLWIIIQFIIFPLNFMSSIYFIFGALQFLCGLWYIILKKQSYFQFDKANYRNIRCSSNILVVYYSRLGYTEKIAYEKADELGAKLFKITTQERTEGLLGFLWLGRFGMHQWPMGVNVLGEDLLTYEKVIIVTPVHVFAVAAPVLGFCEENKGKIKKAEYIAVHFRKDSDFLKVFNRLDEALGTRVIKRESVVCKYGKVINRKVV